MRLALLSTLLAVAACSDGDALRPLSLPPGELAYVAYSDDRLLLEGRLHITHIDDSVVTGTWRIGWAPGADTSVYVGPQVGEGELVGRRLDDRYEIQLNPHDVDNNVYLLARTDLHGWSGEWIWATIAGPALHGVFSARR